MPACAAHGVGFLPQLPLASGLLTGEYRRGEQAPDGTRLAGDMGPSRLTDRAFDVAEAVAAVNAAAGGWVMTPEDRAALDEVLPG